MPSLKTWSTASGVATPSITAKAASLISGISTRLETNPGASFTATGVLPSFSASAWTVAGRVAGRQAAHHLHQRHHRHGIEEVHPDHLLGRL